MNRCQPFLLALLLFVTSNTSCARRAGSHSTQPPMADVIVENRHGSVVRGWLRYGDVRTEAGGILPTAEAVEHRALSGPVPDKASIDLDVFSGNTYQTMGQVVKRVHSEIDVRKQVPPNLLDAALYFIIEQDFSLRLVVMSIEDYQAMKARHERPK